MINMSFKDDENIVTEYMRINLLVKKILKMIF